MQQIYPKISASFLSTSKKDLKNSLLFVYYTYFYFISKNLKRIQCESLSDIFVSHQIYP